MEVTRVVVVCALQTAEQQHASSSCGSSSWVFVCVLVTSQLAGERHLWLRSVHRNNTPNLPRHKTEFYLFLKMLQLIKCLILKVLILKRYFSSVLLKKVRLHLSQLFCQ